MTSLRDLGLRTVINADARLTQLGGSTLPAQVLDAMMEVAGSFVDIFELQEAVGRRLADLTRNEAALVTSGAAAGLTLATLACRTGGDLRLISRLPNAHKDQVVIHSNHHIPYDRAVDLAGAELVTVGTAWQTFDHELDAAFTERTSAVLYVAGSHMATGVLPLSEVVDISHARNIPVIVDAAAQLPPPENLWHFTGEMGADLVVFSGGKALRAPQPSGLLVGRKELINACVANAAPHQRFARALKTGKEEIMALLAAVELYLELDHDALRATYENVVADMVTQLSDTPGLQPGRSFPNEAGQPVPRLRLGVDSDIVGFTASELRERLWEGTPRIAVAVDPSGGVFITPDLLDPGDERIITQRILDEVAIGSRGVG